MPKIVDKNISFIDLFLKTTEIQKAALLNSLTPEQIRLISEIALNTQVGNITASKNDIKKFKKHKPFFKIITSTKNIKKKQRQILKNKKIITLLFQNIIHFSSFIEPFVKYYFY